MKNKTSLRPFSWKLKRQRVPLESADAATAPKRRSATLIRTLFLLSLALGACKDNSDKGTPATGTTASSAPGGSSGTNTGATSRPWFLYQSPVIDMHAHNWTKVTTGSMNDEEHLRKILLAYSEYNVVKAVVSGDGFDGARWAEQYPDIFLAGSMVGAKPVEDSRGQALVPSPSVQELRSAQESGKLHVMAEVGFFYAGLYANGEVARPYFQLAQDLDIPVGYHLMNNAMPNSPKPTNGSPSQFQTVLRDFPGLRLYIMHAGFPFLEETKALLAEFPDLYVEVSWIAVDPQIVGEEFANKFEPYLKDLVDSGYGKRILYGSDTVLSEEIIGQAIKAIDGFSWLSPEQKADIFYFNAARFLKLPEEQITRHWAQ